MAVLRSWPRHARFFGARRRKDGLRGFFWPRRRYAGEEEAGDVAAQIRAALR